MVLLKKLLALCLLLPVFGTAQKKPSYQPYYFADTDRLKKIEVLFPAIEKMYNDYAAANHFPGYAFGIMLDGRLVFKGSNGYTDIGNKTPATTTSMFRIASMSKSFTAMAILQLRDESKLKLDDPLSIYIPSAKNIQLTADAPPVTIRNLLTHSAGFPEDNPWGDRQLADTENELLALYEKGISLSNAPGIAYEYSNLAFATLGYIIHKVSGLPYSEYIAENIWRPLGITDAAWEYTEVPAARLAHGYRWINDSWREETLLHDGIYGSMGGMITSIESFSKYVSLHQSAWPPRNDAAAGVLKRSSLREMHQPWRFNTLNTNYRYGNRVCPIVTAYGYGLSWTKDCDGRVFIAHSGGLPGFGSNWRFLPDYGLGVILFANVTYANTGAINMAVLDTLIRTAKLKPMLLPPSDILKKRQAQLVDILPGWNNTTGTIFAENFFADYVIDTLKKEAAEVFLKAGKIIRVNEMVADNQLRGYFIMEGEKANIVVSFTLSPEDALIQEYHIRSVDK